MPTPTTISDGSLTGDEVIKLIRRLTSRQSFLTLAEAAARVSTTRKQILKWIHDEKLRAYAPLPGKFLVSDRELENFVLMKQVQIKHNTQRA